MVAVRVVQVVIRVGAMLGVEQFAGDLVDGELDGALLGQVDIRPGVGCLDEVEPGWVSGAGRGGRRLLGDMGDGGDIAGEEVVAVGLSGLGHGVPAAAGPGLMAVLAVGPQPVP